MTIELKWRQTQLSFAAIGAGADYALAALYLDKDPSDAVKVACELSCYVTEPIICYTQMKKE